MNIDLIDQKLPISTDYCGKFSFNRRLIRSFMCDKHNVF